jgi:hypothetical protein
MIDRKGFLQVNKVVPCWPQDGTVSRPRGTPLGLETVQGLKAKRVCRTGIPLHTQISSKILGEMRHLLGGLC